MDDEFYSHINNLSDEELLNMVDANSENFTEEAINAAQKEVDARGGTELLYKNIEEQKAQLQFESESELVKEEQDDIETLNNEQYEPSQKGMFSRARTLKEELILDEWAMLLDNAAGNAPVLLNAIQNRLRESDIPGDCTWLVEEVKSSGWFSKVKREFLIVSLDQFKDYHMYIGIRDYGAHLDCCRFLTVEPNFIKKWASSKLTGYADALSAPKNILVHQDLRAWTTVVHHAVLESVEALMNNLNLNPNLIQRESKGFLEIW